VNPPAVIVTKGEPSDPELIALLAALGAMTGQVHDAAPAIPPTQSAWADRTRLLGASPPPGAATWRHSYLP
jgi:hypothetical protein